MFCSAARAIGLCCVVLFAGSCKRQPPPGLQRLAILRFENLNPDPATDWIGRAFAEVISSELATSSTVYAIPSSRLHGLNQSAGVRPVSAPGISAEAPLALMAGATRIGYGEYAVIAGRLHGRLTVEDPRTHRMVQGPIEATANSFDVIGAATALARQLNPQAQPYGTSNAAALEAYAKAMESADAATIGRYAEQAIAADPNFGNAYVILAELKAKLQDRKAAGGVLEAAMSRGTAIPQTDRIRLEILATTLRGDNPGLERALGTLVRTTPLDPAAWRSLAETELNRGRYQEAAQAYQRALAIEPEDVNLLNQLAYAEAYAGNLDAALQALGRYQTLRPASLNPMDSMADVNLIAGRLAEAERLYLEAYKKNPAFLGGADIYKAAMARLMTGDVAGADANAKELAATPLLGAEWLWVTGRRKAAYAKLTAEAPGLPSRDAQSRAYADLAMWALFLNDRDAAGRLAQQAAAQATPSTVPVVAVARFVSLPPTSPTDWAVRAEKLFPNAPPNSIKDFSLAQALLVNRQFEAALPLLRQLEAHSGAGGERSAAIELAWALIETGNFKDASPLLRLNPVPNSNGPGAFIGLYFPRLYRLRAQIAEREGKAEEARENQRIYKALGGE